MSRPLPLHVTLSRLTCEAREKLAAEKLALDVVRNAASAAARHGLDVVTIPLGAAPLERTEAARALASALKGFALEWVEGVSRDGQPCFDLRVIWGGLT